MTNQDPTIKVKEETKKRLDEIGRKNESYDDVLIRLLTKYKDLTTPRQNP